MTQIEWALRRRTGRGLQAECAKHGNDTADMAVDTEPQDNGTRTKLKGVRQRLKVLRDMPEELHDLCDSRGGHAKVVAVLLEDAGGV